MDVVRVNLFYRALTFLKQFWSIVIMNAKIATLTSKLASAEANVKSLDTVAKDLKSANNTLTAANQTLTEQLAAAQQGQTGGLTPEDDQALDAAITTADRIDTLAHDSATENAQSN